jgi:YD repeat-containing protein
MLVKFESKNKENRYNNSMKDNQTIAKFLKVKAFLFVIKDDKGNLIYFEDSDGYWTKREYDAKGNEIYYENSDGFKYEYNDQGNRTYFETSDGIIFDHRPKPMIELTLEDIAKLKGVDASQIRVKSESKNNNLIYD